MIHHLAFGARGVAELAAFYGSAFGLREIRRQLSGSGVLRSVWLDAGGVILMIEHTAEPARVVLGVGQGPFLLAFPTSPAGRSAAEARALGAGARLELRSEFSSYFRDPEDNRCALSCYDFSPFLLPGGG